MPISCLEDGISSHVNLALHPSSNYTRDLCSIPSASMEGLTLDTQPSRVRKWMVGLAGLVDLPWNRVGVWAVVVWFMYSLRDFFGVSCTMTGILLQCKSLRCNRHASTCVCRES